MAFVQATCNSTPTGAGTAHLTQAYTSNVTAGNLLVVFTCSQIETPSISDTLGTSWTPVTSVDDAGDGERLQCWIGTAPSSGANTVDVTYSSALGDGWISVAEFSGRGGAVTVAATVKMNPSGAPPFLHIPSGSTVAIAAHDDLITAAVKTGAYGTGNWSAGAGFTERAETGGASQLNGQLQTQDDVAADAAYSATVQSVDVGDTCVGILLALAQSGGGAVTNHMRRIHPF